MGWSTPLPLVLPILLLAGAGPRPTKGREHDENAALEVGASCAGTLKPKPAGRPSSCQDARATIATRDLYIPQ
eukprot:6537152-Pyramimonas_sp.AAC.1